MENNENENEILQNLKFRIVEVSSIYHNINKKAKKKVIQ